MEGVGKEVVVGDMEDKVIWNVDDNNDEEDNSSIIVVGKVWAIKNVNANALIEILKKLWQPKHGMEARKLDDNLFSFQLFHCRDKLRIMEGKPWHFDKYAMCLSDLQDDRKPSDLQLRSLPMWVLRFADQGSG